MMQFSTVEIEVNSRCNRHCSYCPVSVLPAPNVPRLMSDEVFERLLDELARAGFAGRVSYHFYNEPLLRKDLERLVAWAVRRLPGTYHILYTNGDLLTDERYESLLRAGVDLFVVTSHDMTPRPERPSQIVRYPPELELTNRGGAMGHLPGATSKERGERCYAPSEMLIVTADGDVLLCYEDARRENVMGNLLRNSLDEIWNAEEFVRARELLALGKRAEAGAICQQCTNLAHVVPGTSHLP